MREIEIKASLRDRNHVIEKLKKLGCFLSEPMHQIDTVYTRIPAKNVEEYLKNDHFVRIREKSDGRFIFTVKKPLSKEVLTKTEHETEIKNAKELEQALFLMGYQVANKVIKVRQTTSINNFEICIDEVENMGSFIEIEKMSEINDDLIRKELADFLISLEISPSDEIRKGYDILSIENLSKTTK